MTLESVLVSDIPRSRSSGSGILGEHILGEHIYTTMRKHILERRHIYSIWLCPLFTRGILGEQHHHEQQHEKFGGVDRFGSKPESRLSKVEPSISLAFLPTEMRCVCICTYMYIYVYIHKNTHTHTHTKRENERERKYKVEASSRGSTRGCLWVCSARTWGVPLSVCLSLYVCIYIHLHICRTHI